jgi:hypothetical protein
MHDAAGFDQVQPTVSSRSAGYADYMQTQDFQDGLQLLLQAAEQQRPAAYMCAEMVSNKAAKHVQTQQWLHKTCEY